MGAAAVIALLLKAAPIVQGAWENREEIEGVVRSIFNLAVKNDEGTATEADYLETDAKLDASLLKFNSLKRPVG